ncbi:hypothetical protein Fmac_001741 [Flemingia macrophylla]|uniref:Uncharacterized protein n=1 Tax=Flemingia macrophylla TaxID=520843 RepID=A0ABD1NHY9_9FABA
MVFKIQETTIGCTVLQSSTSSDSAFGYFTVSFMNSRLHLTRNEVLMVFAHSS